MSGVRLLLDEDVRSLLATILVERGHDVITATQLGLNGAEDDEVLDRAVREHRAVLTHNIGDYLGLAAQYANRNWEHFGIILSNHLPVGTLIARILRLLAKKSAEDLMNAVEWLHNFR